MRQAALIGRSSGISRSASQAAHYSVEQFDAAAFFEKMMAYADVETPREMFDFIARGRYPKRKKRTPGKYFFAGATAGAALAFQRLRRQRQMRRIIRLRRQQQENRPQRQKTGGNPIDE